MYEEITTKQGIGIVIMSVLMVCLAIAGSWAFVALTGGSENTQAVCNSQGCTPF